MQAPTDLSGQAIIKALKGKGFLLCGYPQEGVVLFTLYPGMSEGKPICCFL